MKAKTHHLDFPSSNQTDQTLNNEDLRKEIAKIWGWNSHHLRIFDEMSHQAKLYEICFK